MTNLWQAASLSIVALRTLLRLCAADEPAPLTLPDNPYPKSDLIQGFNWLGSEIHDGNAGDVWSTTWADDDNLYSVADDAGLEPLCL